MAEGEKVTLQKWISGFISPLTNAKNLQTLVWLIVIGLVGVTIWRAYFRTTQKQNQQQIIKVEQGAVMPGGTLNLNPKQGQEQNTKEKSWETGPFAGVVGNGDDQAVFVGWVLLRRF